MKEQTTYSPEEEQRRTSSPLTLVGQQVRLTLGRLICPPTEVGCVSAAVTQLERPCGAGTNRDAQAA